MNSSNSLPPMTNPEAPSTAPVTWCQSEDFRNALFKRQSFSGWRQQHTDCDMALYAHPQTSATQPTGPSMEEVGTLISWLLEKATQAADTGASKDAGMLTWAAQVIGERVDEDVPDVDQAEGPNPSDEEIDLLWDDVGMYYELYTQARALVRAALGKWGLIATTSAIRTTLEQLVRAYDTNEGLPITEWITTARAALAAEPVEERASPEELIGLALEREPWATWLRSGACLESAHCELADLMLAALARWDTTTTTTTQTKPAQLVKNAESDEPSKEQIEEAAKLIYASMRSAVPDGYSTPDWVEHGNSLMQDEARRTARTIFVKPDCPATPSAPEPLTQPAGRSGLTWEAAINGLREVLTDQTDDATQRVWQRSRILDALELMAANQSTPSVPSAEKLSTTAI